MAVYHYSASAVSRGQGQSIIAKAAYNARAKLVDEASGEIKDFSAKTNDVEFSGIFVEGAAPPAMKKWREPSEDINLSREELWNKVTDGETRKDSQFAREIVASLPYELTAEERKWLVREFVRDHFMQKGMIADVNIHRPDEEGDERNFHVHILLTMREIGWKDFTIQKDGETYSLSKASGLNAGELRDFMKKGLDRDSLPELELPKGKKRAAGKAAEVHDEVRKILAVSKGNGALFRKELARKGYVLGNPGPKGFGLKVREWNTVEQLEQWREAWAVFTAKQLGKAAARREKLGLNDEAEKLKLEATRFMYSHKTLKEQRAIALERGDTEYAEELKREPQQSKGWYQSAQERKRQKEGDLDAVEDLFGQQKTETTNLSADAQRRRARRSVETEFATSAKQVGRSKFPYRLPPLKKTSQNKSTAPPVPKGPSKGKKGKNKSLKHH